MTFKKFCIIGMKVLAAVGAAAAVWIGFSKSPSNHQANRQDQRREEECSLEKKDVNQGKQVVTSLRKFQDTCGKIFSVAQSLATVGENLYRIFNGCGSDPYYQQPRGCSQGFTRVTANIIEAGYDPASSSAWGTQSRYCF